MREEDGEERLEGKRKESEKSNTARTGEIHYLRSVDRVQFAGGTQYLGLPDLEKILIHMLECLRSSTSC